MANRRLSGFDVIDDDISEIVDVIGSKSAAFAGKTIFITGASGFLAAYLADTFAAMNDSGVLERPCRLVLLVRDASRADTRLGRLRGRPDTVFVHADVSGPFESPLRADFIIHAASPASPSAYFNDPVGCMDANLAGLRTMLEYARTWEVESFLYFSSSEVYGSVESARIPTPETYVGRVDPLGKRACYAEAKRAGEAYCRAYFDQYGVKVKIVRIFHTYGPGLYDDGRIVPALVANGLRKERFSLLSDGLSTRAHAYVSDATVDMLNVLLSDHNGEAFNVGGDREISVLELAGVVARIFGRSHDIAVNQSPSAKSLAGAADRVCPDLSKIRSAFGALPRVGLDEGIERYIRWLRQQPNHEGPLP